MNSEERRLTNFIECTDEGQRNQALSKVLDETELKIDGLQLELERLRQAQKEVFQIPPIEWITARINQLAELLEQNMSQSALVLRKVLGPIELEAIYPEIGKSYSITRSSLNALAVIESPSKPESLDNGSSVWRWWAWKECIRTLGVLKIHCEFQRCVATK